MRLKIGLLPFFAIVVGLVGYIFQNFTSDFKSKSEMIVYQSKTCGCCKKWVKHLTDDGFKVKSVLLDDVSETKTKLGIPQKLSSCHTATINGYLVEGHVPASAIKKLLKDRPEVQGISVPGMPIGSPGMESSHVEAYNVISFTEDGTQKIFAQY